MNAREHFEIAERLLVSCRTDDGDEHNAPTYPAHEDGLNSIGNALLAAQVHATLALAAAHGANEPTLSEVLPPAED